MSRLSSKRIPVHSSSRRDAERSRFQGSSKGQEANAVGFILALREDDWLIPAFRELGALIAKGENWLLKRSCLSPSSLIIGSATAPLQSVSSTAS